MKKYWIIIGLVICYCCSTTGNSKKLWDLALKNKENLIISTLFTAQNVRNYLSTEEGINDAIDWCKKTGVTHVYLETYRSRYTAERKVLENAKEKYFSFILIKISIKQFKYCVINMPFYL